MIFTVVFSVMTFNMCSRSVLILVFFRFPPKLTTAQLRHLEIGIDATDHDISVLFLFGSLRCRVRFGSVRFSPCQNVVSVSVGSCWFGFFLICSLYFSKTAHLHTRTSETVQPVVKVVL